MESLIDARDLFAFIDERRPSNFWAIERDMLSYLKAGKIAARASAAITTSHFGKRSQDDDCDVDPSVWGKWEGRDAILSLSSARFTNRDVGSHASAEFISLRFNLADVARMFGVDTGLQASPAITGQAGRGTLPPSAKPKHKRFEQAAHRSAEIVRERACLRAEAIRAAIDERAPPGSGSTETKERGVRETFDLMYQPNGNRHPN